MADIYGENRQKLEVVLDRLVQRVKEMRSELTGIFEFDPVEHILARVKSDESMREKCRRKGLPETSESALTELYDALGIRIVCAFLSDVYAMVDRIREDPEFEVLEERDYIKNAKPNGYRSYHMITRSKEGYYCEIQLRTISMDTWAALEHHLHYKKAKMGNERLIVGELKRCADELASTDVSMQTLRDMIVGND